MLTFIKYNSVEPTYVEDSMRKIRDFMPADALYSVQEKVHGSNVCFLCDGENIEFASREKILEKTDKFFNYTVFAEEHREKVIKLFDRIKEDHPKLKSINAFGEFFGGTYPAEGVENYPDLQRVQKGVYYSPKYEFYGFDIYIDEEGVEGHYLTVTDVDKYYGECGFLYAKTLFKGTLDECLKYPNKFQTHIPEWLGLPPIKDNVCEGVVIKPIEPKFLKSGKRVIIKNKNEKFVEKWRKKNITKEFSEPIPKSEKLKKLIEEGLTYINENRLDNVISHIGEVTFPKDFGRVLKDFSIDVIDDFMKENSNFVKDLDKYEQGMLRKELSRESNIFVKKVVNKEQNAAS